MTPPLMYALLGMLSGLPLVLLARRRTSSVPVPQFPEDEELVLRRVAEFPHLYPVASMLEPHHFSGWSRAESWAEVRTAVREVGGTAEKVPERPDGSLEEIRARVELSDAAARVFLAAVQREKRGGRARVSGPARRSEVMRWVPGPVGASEVVVVSLLCAAGMAAAARLAAGQGELVLLSLLVLVAGSAVVSLVDVDTLLLDVRFWSLVLLLSWSLLVVQRVLEGDVSSVVVGLGVVYALVIFSELVGFFLGRATGRALMGRGDYVIALGTVGAPAAASGSFLFGAVSFGFAAVAAAVAFIVARMAGVRVYPAFGPFLASGWVAALLVTGGPGGGLF